MDPGRGPGQGERNSKCGYKQGINMPRHASQITKYSSWGVACDGRRGKLWGTTGHTLKPRLSTKAEAKVIPGFST